MIGLDHIRHKLFGMDIEHLGVRSVLQQFVANRVDQMGFAQSHATVDEQGVVELARDGGHVHGCGAGHAIGRPLYQGVKGQRAVKAGFKAVGGLGVSHGLGHGE